MLALLTMMDLSIFEEFLFY